MKKFLALLFVLVLCFAVVGCNTGASTKTDPAAQSNIDKAMAFVNEIYKSDSKDKPTVDTGDYNLLTNVPISGENFTVTWKIEKINEADLDVAEIVTAEDGTFKVAVKYEAGYNTVATDYKLTATVTNGTDTLTRTYNRQVPAFAFTTYEEWLSNCKAGSSTVMNIKAYVIGVVSTSSSSGGSMYLQDAEGHGYYAYNPTLDAADKASDEALRAAFPIGCEVIVSGTGTVYGGQYEFNKGCTVKKTGNSIDAAALITADASEVFAAASDNKSTTLIPYQNTLVTLKNCTLVNVDGSYYYFTIGENLVKFNIYDNTYFIDAATQKAWKDNFKPGYTATITGIVSCFSNAYQIYPVSADVITGLEAPDSKTFAESLALNPFASTVLPYNGMIFNLPLAGTGDNASVSIAWALDKEYAFVTLVDGVLTVNLPAEKTTIKLTATLTAAGEATITKDFELTVNSSEINWTSVADAIAACGALDGASKETSTDWYYIKSNVVDTPTADYANFNFADGDTQLKVYGLYDLYAAKRYGTKRQIAEIPFGMGDIVALYCQLQNYNGTLEIVNARLLFVEKTEVTDEIKVATTKSELTVPGTVNEAGDITLPTGKTYADVNISWALDAEYAFASIADGKLVISSIPDTAATLTLTATITSGEVTDTVVFKVAVKKLATMPALETPFVFAVDQNKVDKTLYFAGSMSGNFLATTEDMDLATEVKIEAVDGGYRIYFMDGETKKYIDIYEYSSGKVGVRLTTEPTAVFTFDNELGIFTATVIEKIWYLGTYNTFTTLSASETYRISGDNASAVGASQFVCYFTTKVVTEKTAEEKVDHELGNLTVDTLITAAGDKTLAIVGAKYDDVTITWTSDNINAVISEGKVTYTLPTDADVTVKLIATVKCGDVEKTKEFEVTVKKYVVLSSVAKYTTVLNKTSSFTDNAAMGADDLKVITDTCVGTDIITSITGVKMYAGYTGYLGLGLKFGTSSAPGSVTFKLTQKVSKITVVVAGWKDTDKVSVNGGAAQTPGVAYNAEGCLQTLTFELAEASDTITLTFTNRGYLQSVEFFA